MINTLFIFIVSLFLVIRGSTLATKYAAMVASNFHLSKYTVGFIVVAIISILPETFISINAALAGIPSFGLGMLFGSNIADLTLIFAIIIWVAGRGLKVESKILKNHSTYPFLLLLPLILGFDGHFSRLEGLALVIAGGIFYYISFKRGAESKAASNSQANKKSIIMLVFSMIILLVGSHFTVDSASQLARYLGVSPILVGMLVVGIGTTMPELFFSLKSVRKRDDSLAIGDILGTVLADATIVVGILALINPFSFPVKIIYITGIFMVISSFALFRFMRSGRTISKKEAYTLFVFWLIFIIVEFFANQ
ncbi:MAG: sodium:calcium antiporter [Candidatus Buchananbacteria bacterium]|nr:sodium:calcium antiporter [Candidatus Buchananbacteria bacterium]